MTSPRPLNIIRHKTPSGFDILLNPSPGSGLIALNVLIRRGGVDESPSEIGHASFTASMLKRGTTTRSSSEIAFALESLGAMSSHASGADAAVSSLHCAAADFSDALDVFLDCLANPAFSSQELEIERQSALAALRRIEDDKFDFTYREYIKRIFAGHGYGHPPEGEKKNVESVTPDACRAWHAKSHRPENMMLTIAGDFDADVLKRMLDAKLAKWPAGSAITARCVEPTPPPGTAAHHAIEKELEQGFIVMGYRCPPLVHADHTALRLGCAILGEGFSGRLFRHLRDERSLAYAVGSLLRALRLGGHTVLYIGTQPERLQEAHDGLLEQVGILRATAPDAADLERAREYVIGKYLMSHQSLGSRAGYLAQWEDSGLGAEYDRQHVEDLRKVTPDQVHAAAQQWWTAPTSMTLRPLLVAAEK